MTHRSRVSRACTCVHVLLLPVLPRSCPCLQLEARRAEAARWRDLVDSRDALAGEREALLAQVGLSLFSESLLAAHSLELCMPV